MGEKLSGLDYSIIDGVEMTQKYNSGLNMRKLLEFLEANQYVSVSDVNIKTGIPPNSAYRLIKKIAPLLESSNSFNEGGRIEKVYKMTDICRNGVKASREAGFDPYNLVYVEQKNTVKY